MSEQTNITESQRRMVVHILHTANFLDTKISEVLKDFGITHVQYNILKVLEASHPTPLSVGKIKEGILFANSDMTRLMDRLVAKDLVCRDFCPNNRRKVDVELTKSGLKMLKEIEPLISLALSAHVGDITEDNAKLISNKMKEIRS